MKDDEFKEFRDLRAKFESTVWGLSSWRFSSSEGKKFYESVIDHWTTEVQGFCDSYPVESGKFLFHLFSDEFLAKVDADWQYIFRDKSELRSVDKLSFISSSYEHAYYYLALVTLSTNRTKISDGSTYSNWFSPKKGQELSRNKADSWKIDNTLVSGRNWVINYSPFNAIYSAELERWKLIRNKYSHNGILVKGEEVFLLNNKKYEDITNEVDRIFEAVKLICEVSLHFIYSRVFNHGIYIYPSVVMFYKDRFLPSSRLIDYGLVNKLKNPILKNRPAISRTFDFIIENRNRLYKIFYKIRHGKNIDSVKDNYDENIETMVMLSFTFLSIFTNVDVLSAFINKIDKVNEMLATVHLKVSEEIIKKIMDEAVLEGEYISYTSVTIMANKLLQIEIEPDFKDPEQSLFDNNELRDKFFSYKVQVIAESVKVNNPVGLILMYMNLMYKSFMPVGYIQENLSKLTPKK